MTEPERKLWARLKAQRFIGKWRRQQPIGRYIAYFVCQQANLIVEVDGSQHCESQSDTARTQWLNKAGYKVIRFWNNEVLENMEGVLIRINEVLDAAPSPTSTSEKVRKSAYPLPQGERKGALNSSPLEGEDSEAEPQGGLAQLGEGAEA